MMNEDDWVRDIQELVSEGGFRNQLFQIAAKSMSNEILETPSEVAWRYDSSTIVRNISSATLGIEIIARNKPSYLESLKDAIRSIAKTWEHLAKLNEGTSRDIALLNSAVLYNLAGYQANSICLTRFLGYNFDEMDTGSVQKLSSAFLQRLFVRVLNLSEISLDGFESGYSIYETKQLKLAYDDFRSGIKKATLFFLNGTISNIDPALSDLESALRKYMELGFVQESNLIHSILALLPVIMNRSTWTLLSDYITDNPRWRRYLKLLSRGLGPSLINSSSVSELWSSQIECLEKGLLQHESSKIIKMPTSSGKTRAAELAIVDTLTSHDQARCIYIAPYNALAWEIEESFQRLFGDLGYYVSSVTGSYEWDNYEQLLASDADILILTPEKLDLLNRVKPEFLDNVRLFVMDEVQIVNDETRGVKFEFLLTRLKKRLPNAKFLLLSAVISNDNLHDFANWLQAEPDTDILQFDWRPAEIRFGKFKWTSQDVGRIQFTPNEGESEEFIHGVTTSKKYIDPQRPRAGTIFPKRDNKSEIAADLALSFSKMGPVLVYCPQTNEVEGVGKAIYRLLDLRYVHAEGANGIPSYLDQTDTTKSLVSAEKWLGSEHSITKLLGRGIAVHHGRLPRVLRKSIEQDFRDGKYRILVATNTLAQGVNLPIRTVIMRSCKRYDRKLKRRVLIPTREYWNIAGRAGRAGKETNGIIIHIVVNNPDETNAEYYLSHRSEVESQPSSLFRYLTELVNKRISESTLIQMLDPEVLALLVEEGSSLQDVDYVREILKETMSNHIAIRKGVEIDRLAIITAKTATRIIKSTSDELLLRVYSNTGLCTKSCELISEYVREHAVTIKSVLTNKDTSVNDFLFSIMPIVSDISEMEPRTKYDGNITDLLLLWLTGKEFPVIFNEVRSDFTSIEKLTKFVGDMFEYRFPWGFSGVIRIAKHLLQLKEEELTEFTVFISSMIKSGLPNPVSSWAMMSGIPFRSIAIRVAEEYLSEQNKPDYAHFKEWISSFSSETLRRKFGLDNPFLEDITQTLSNLTTSTLIRENPNVDEVLPIESWVKGIAYEEDRFEVATNVSVDDELVLVREYNNIYDHNAILLMHNNKQLGYLDKHLAKLLAVEIDCGKTIKCVVVEMTESNKIFQMKIKLF